MNIKSFLNTVCKEIKYKPARIAINNELEMHMQELKEEYKNNGLQPYDAEEKAVSQMGIAEDIGKKLNKIHKPKLDWKLLILIAILMGFGIVVSVFKHKITLDNCIGQTLFFMSTGIILGIMVYLLDYKQMKRYSNVIYLIATIIMFLPIIGLCSHKINGISYVYIFRISFLPCVITIPLYIVSFIGYMCNYDSKNTISILKNKITLNKSMLKIICLCLLSIVLILILPSFINALILSIIYLVISTITIKQRNAQYIKKLTVLYSSFILLLILLAIAIGGNIYKDAKLNNLFNLESYSLENKNISILQKEVLEKAKLLGNIESSIFSSNEFFISKKSNLTFLYLLGKIGIILSSLLIFIIILTSIKLIFNTKKIKDLYGKSLMIGFSTLYILQSIGSVLSNIILGITIDVDLPFVAYGGVSIIVNSINIAIILSVYRRKDISQYDETYEIDYT